jgi:hypothetical protein
MYGENEMANARRDASTIKTLRLALGPGASAITQLAAAVTGRSARRSGRMSVAGFFFPYLPGFPVLAYPGRKPLAPAIIRKASFTP